MPSYTPEHAGRSFVRKPLAANPRTRNISGCSARPAKPVCRFGTELSQPASPIAPQLCEFAAGGAELPKPGSGNCAERLRTRSRSRLPAISLSSPRRRANKRISLPRPYHPANQPVRQQSFQSAEHPGAQGYPASSYNGAQAYPSQPFGNQNYADASFPEPGSGDASFPESSFDQNFTDQNFGNQNFAKANFADASFPELQGFDCKLPRHELSQRAWFRAAGAGHGLRPWRSGRSRLRFFSTTNRRRIMARRPAKRPAAAIASVRRHLRSTAADCVGLTEPPRRPAQDFYEGERLDADFLDEGQAIPAPGARAKSGMTFKGRSAFMVGSALLGAIALGGALAFAYKSGGGRQRSAALGPRPTAGR